jgi:DNA-binding protein HU-beta
MYIDVFIYFNSNVPIVCITTANIVLFYINSKKEPIMALGKKEIAATVAARMEADVKATEATVNTTFDVMGEELAKGEQINIAGFGQFSVRDRAARTGRNPSTGEAIEIPASKVAAFKAAKGLKTLVNK